MIRRPISSLRASRFSLLELLVAIAILGMALATSLLMISQAQRGLVESRRDWADQHAMSQAVEYFLLCGPAELELPGGLLPAGYSADCQVRSVLEDLPEFARQPLSGWVLAEYVVSLYRVDGSWVATQQVRKLVQEDDL